ncbi:MAG: DUF2953 domain-containing protein [Clostridia bacterium]|nr:DUF2953 domain-containing protein [Clostridia bacterium]
MKVLLIILAVICGIVALICAVLSVKAIIRVNYENGKFTLAVQWAFLKLDLIPWGLKKKEKKPAEEKKEEEPPAEEEKKEEEPKKKGSNPLKTFYDNKGVQGIYELIYDLFSALTGFAGRIVRKIRLDEFFVYITVGSSDAAKTAMDYGKISGALYPCVGYICTHMPVGKYDVNVQPDFLSEKTVGELHTVISFRPIVLTNAGVALVFRLLFTVVVKFIKGIKTPKNAQKNNGGKPAAGPSEPSGDRVEQTAQQPA